MDISDYPHDTMNSLRNRDDVNFRGRHFVHFLPDGRILKFPGIDHSLEIEISLKVSDRMKELINDGMSPDTCPFPIVYENGILPDGAPYFIMENVGKPLSLYVREGSIPITRDELISGVQRALDILDGMGIAHEDVENLGNILLRKRIGSDQAVEYTVSIIDFGNAQYSKRKNSINMFVRMLRHYERFFP